MGLRERFVTGETGQRRELPWRTRLRPALEIEQRETGRVEPAGFATQREYTVSLRVYTNFWANTAQVSQAREIAERTVVAALYADAIERLQYITNLIYSGDQDEALAAVLELKRELETP